MFSTAQQQQLRALQTPTATWEVHSQLIVFVTRATREKTGDLARRVKQGNIKKRRDLTHVEIVLTTQIHPAAAM